MPSTKLLTSDDLDEIGSSSFDAGQPLDVAAELVDVVDRSLLADQADTGYALILAAEIIDRGGDLHGAAALAERAVQAYRVHGDPDFGYPRAFRAELWMRLGRTEEAMAEFAALRPLLTRWSEAASYLTSALERCGRAELAEQWLTAGLTTALQNRQKLEPQRLESAYPHAAEVAYGLAQQRRRLRRDLDLPHDEHDDFADQLWDAMHDALNEDQRPYEGTALLFWPRSEFDDLLARWPTLAEAYGSTWDEHRTALERGLTRWWESGQPRLALMAGAVDELASYADREGGDPTDPRVRQAYAQHLEAHPRETA